VATVVICTFLQLFYGQIRFKQKLGTQAESVFEQKLSEYVSKSAFSSNFYPQVKNNQRFAKVSFLVLYHWQR
jgi:hypothetical protein